MWYFYRLQVEIVDTVDDKNGRQNTNPTQALTESPKSDRVIPSNSAGRNNGSNKLTSGTLRHPSENKDFSRFRERISSLSK